MHLQGNTLFITGGGSGIGRGLAEAFHQLGNNQVIIGGRREDVLRATCAANPGMQWITLDTTNAASIQSAAERLTRDFPALNVVINNAGIQRLHDFAIDTPLDDDLIAQEIETNFTGVIRLCAAFLPHLRRQESATLINVSSGLALVPLARFPVYCATKAAVHSFTQSLRYQLRDTCVKVVELIPPYVDTELGHTSREVRPTHGGPPPMPLADYVQAAMQELQCGGENAAVGTAKTMLAATQTAPVREAFERMNTAWR